MKEFTGYLMNMVGLIEIEFAEFWNAYPRKVGKIRAEKLWAKMSYQEQSKALDGLSLWCRSMDWRDPMFIPHASTFLNQRRWEEKPAAMRPQRVDRGEKATRGAIYSASDMAWYKQNGFKL